MQAPGELSDIDASKVQNGESLTPVSDARYAVTWNEPAGKREAVSHVSYILFRGVLCMLVAEARCTAALTSL